MTVAATATLAASTSFGQDDSFDPSANQPSGDNIFAPENQNGDSSRSGGGQTTTQPKQNNNNTNRNNTPPAPAPSSGGSKGGGKVSAAAQRTKGEKAVGKMLAPVTAFSNMEKGYHITERGYRAILKANGTIIAAGPMNIKAAIKGKRSDSSGAYTAMTLNIAMTYVSPDIASGSNSGGSGQLSFCMNNNAKAKGTDMGCQEVAGGFAQSGGENEDRMYQMVDCPVTYSVPAAGTVQINSYDCLPSGNEGNAQAIGVSLHHPVYGFAAKNKSFKDYQSPLVLDLAGDGLNLVDVYDETKKIMFDIEGDGLASRTGWVTPADGMLAMDFNGNGVIDDGRELFSNFTYDKDETDAGAARRFANGFAALGQLDDNTDGAITKADKVWGKLRVWRDLNQNGKAEPNELKSLDDMKIAEISLAYEATSNTNHWTMVAGNEVRYTAKFKYTDGRSFEIADVYFKQRRNLEAQVDQGSTGEVKK
jgi:hypothetical protein